MIARKVAGGYLVRLEKGEETVSSLSSFIGRRRIGAGVIFGIGAIRNPKIGYFDAPRKSYRKTTIRKTVEVVSLSGNVSYLHGRPFVHLHVAVADDKYRLRGGHLFQAEVAVTLELYIRVFSRKLVRKPDPETGFNFWQL